MVSRFWAKLAINCPYHATPLASRLVVGSSRSNIGVLDKIAKPNLVRCFMPDEKKRICLLAACVSSICSKKFLGDS